MLASAATPRRRRAGENKAGTPWNRPIVHIKTNLLSKNATPRGAPMAGVIGELFSHKRRIIDIEDELIRLKTQLSASNPQH